MSGGKRWRGTALFSVLLAVMSVTVAGRMLTHSEPGSRTADAASGTTGTGTESSGAVSGSAPTPAAGQTVVTGEAEETRYGAVQVALTYKSGKIIAVTELQAPSESGRDVQLNSFAAPTLEQEVIASQSARVDSVSGATYTSQGYLASVQSAIDKKP